MSKASSPRGLTTHPLILDGPNGHLFALHTVADTQTPRGTLLIIPPLAEEMNRSRRLVRSLSIELAAKGFDTISMDLSGTGDSGGELAGQRWHHWMADLSFVVGWAEQNCSDRLSLLGIRLGGLLAAQIAETCSVKNLVLWHTPARGDLYLNSIGKQAAFSGKSGQSGAISLPGYQFHPDFAADVRDLVLTNSRPRAEHIFCIEQEVIGTSPYQDALEAWRLEGKSCQSIAVSSPAYWALEQPTPCDTLIEETVSLLVREEVTS